MVEQPGIIHRCVVRVETDRGIGQLDHRWRLIVAIELLCKWLLVFSPSDNGGYFGIVNKSSMPNKL